MTEDTASLQPARTITGRRSDAPVLLACALVVALICGLHHGILAIHLAREHRPYVPLGVVKADPATVREALDSAPRIRDVLDGVPFSADPTGLEHKRRLPFLGEGMLDSLVAGAVGLLLGRDVLSVFIFCDFVLPPLCFLILIAVCRRLGAPLWVSIAAATAGILGHEAVVAPFSRLVGVPFHAHPLAFTGLTMPQLAFIPAGLAVLGLVTSYDQPRPRRALFAGCMIGLTAYCAVEFWAWVLAGGVALLLVAATRPAARRSTVSLLVAVAVGLLLSMPMVLQLLVADGYAGKAEMAPRRIADVGFVWVQHLPALLLPVSLAALYPKRRRETVPVLCFALAPLLCLGANALWPFATDAARWTSFCALPWGALMVALLVWAGWSEIARRRAGEGGPAPEAVRARERRQDTVFGLLALLAALYGGGVQFRFAGDNPMLHSLPPGQYEALTQLALRPEENVVLCVEPRLRTLLAATTSCDLYLPRAASSPMSEDEIIDRLAVAAQVYGWTREYLSAQLARSPDPAFLGAWLFPAGPPPGLVERVMGRAEFYGEDALQEARHRVDLVVWGPDHRTSEQAKAEKAFADRLFIEAGDIRVYRAHPLPPGEKVQREEFRLPEIEAILDGKDAGGSNPQVGREDADHPDDRAGAGVD